MQGLIPLMLNATGGRSGAVFPGAEKMHARGQSTSFLPVPVRSPRSLSVSSDASRRSSMPPTITTKTASFVTASSLPSIRILPYTPEEWRRTIADLKRHHLNHRYQVCLTQCREILDNISAINVEPAYLISLHFFAATSLEMYARLLQGSNSHRKNLIRQSREHYDQAAVLIARAEETVLSRSRPCSPMSLESSLYSPSSSVSSRAWTVETAFSSPTASVCSLDDLKNRSQLPRPTSTSPSPQASRKTVSFELPKQAASTGPYIRPDSPTLGFDDEYFTAALNRPPLPELPKRPQTPELIVEPTEENGPMLDHFRDSFIMRPSEHRYCMHLMTLKTQIALHKSSLDGILENESVETNEVLSRASTPVNDELRELDKRARIERLRKNGWQRKRFDPSRYEALRMSALADLC